MKFKRSTCPNCGKRPERILETVQAQYYITHQGGGEYDYDAWQASDVDWESSEPIVDDAGRVTLTCPDGHEWEAKMAD